MGQFVCFVDVDKAGRVSSAIYSELVLTEAGSALTWELEGFALMPLPLLTRGFLL